MVARVKTLSPDHILITGDLTTTALETEFQGARLALADLLADRERTTVLPGNHDRYTTNSVRSKKFEAYFGEFAPRVAYPWLRFLDDHTAILGLDPTRSHISARGFLPPAQLVEAQELFEAQKDRIHRLIVACHYPVTAPRFYQSELNFKRLKNAADLRTWLAGIGPHVYCCGHVHAAWALVPPEMPNQLCLNSGAPLLRDHTGYPVSRASSSRIRPRRRRRDGYPPRLDRHRLDGDPAHPGAVVLLGETRDQQRPCACFVIRRASLISPLRFPGH